MDFMQAVRTVLKNYAVFDGRSGRAEFWWWVLAYFIGAIIVGLIGGALGTNILGWLYTLALIVPYAAVGVRRFHDVGKQAWWVILLFIPIVNIIIALIFLTKPSDSPNKYGEAPQAPA